MFTSINLVKDYLGSEGVSLLTDDLSSSTTEITRAIQEAQDYILMHLMERYDEAGLTPSTWVQRRATELACYFLYSRRAQEPPTGLYETFHRITEELTRIGNTVKLQIPGAFPRESQAPSVANYAVDQRRLSQRCRVDGVSSTNDYPGRPDYNVDLFGIGDA